VGLLGQGPKYTSANARSVAPGLGDYLVQSPGVSGVLVPGLGAVVRHVVQGGDVGRAGVQSEVPGFGGRQGLGEGAVSRSRSGSFGVGGSACVLARYRPNPDSGR
jgi:hypothetical protein